MYRPAFPPAAVWIFQMYIFSLSLPSCLFWCLHSCRFGTFLLLPSAFKTFLEDTHIHTQTLIHTYTRSDIVIAVCRKALGNWNATESKMLKSTLVKREKKLFFIYIYNWSCVDFSISLESSRCLDDRENFSRRASPKGKVKNSVSKLLIFFERSCCLPWGPTGTKVFWGLFRRERERERAREREEELMRSEASSVWEY